MIFLYNINIEYYSRGEKMIIIAIIFVAVVLTCIGLIISIKREPKKEAIREDISIKLSEVGIVNDNIKSYVSFSNNDGCLIYTKKDKLFLIRDGKEDYNNIDIKEINLDDILEVKVDVQIKERSKMKIVSVVPTFDKHTTILKANMIITTLDEVINLMVDNSILFEMRKIFIRDQRYGFDWESKINELNRLKLLINRKISKEV